MQEKEDHITRCLKYLNNEYTKEQRITFEIDLLLEQDLALAYKKYKQIWLDYPTCYSELQPYALEDKVGMKQKYYSVFVLKVLCAFLFSACCFLVVSGNDLLGSFTSESYSYVNNSSDRKLINLVDGSLVTLNANSSIDFTIYDNLREVKLQGEAYFEVSKNSNKEFQVKGKGFTVRVLGTCFSVNNSGDIKTVSLLSGKLLTHIDNGDILYLNPDEKLFIDIINMEVSREKFSAKKELSWKDNHLIFTREPIKRAMPRIENYYGVKFSYSDVAFGDLPLTGEFKNHSLQEFIKTFEFITNTQIIFTNSIYTIKPNADRLSVN